MTQEIFREDSYLRSCDATVTGADAAGVRLDRTVFYPTGGGQPGDVGTLIRADGSRIAIRDTVKGASPGEIVHVLTEPADISAGEKVSVELDWERRHRLMRMHTCLHLLCSLVKFPVTGGQIGVDEGRLDFDIEDASAVDKDKLTADLNALIAADHPVTERWITDEELDANPGLVRTMAVQPPRGAGKVRLVLIGENGSVDMQPCGGTHVKRTGEIGSVAVSKIEKKGKLNRRIRVAFAEGR
jgi:misacylated tRNA(Ala) deacylase